MCDNSYNASSKKICITWLLHELKAILGIENQTFSFTLRFLASKTYILFFAINDS